MQKLWDRLLNQGASPLCDLAETASKPAAWWKPAFALMAIADEACADIGYQPPPGADWERKWVVKLANNFLAGSAPAAPRSRHLRHSNHRPTITSSLVDPDVVCVQPKARTPDVGCSLRNLSHNVALLPPRGIMRVHWLTPPTVQSLEDDTSLNLLLVPFPYAIRTSSFRSRRATPPGSPVAWGWFEVHQDWLGADADLVVDLVRALLRQAEDHEQIHGIVFPELSLSYEVYERLASCLRDQFPSVQFLVSGASSNCGGDTGNFALASHFFADATGAAAGSNGRMMATVSRAKHHRWSLEVSQIRAYGLETAFPDELPEMRWWEDIPLRAREVHVNAMRSASVFSVMICEDLARSDPAHEPLRAIGPNLVFVLLMDGPQLEWRWAARYSTGLAEDPGTSVLTLTSRALVERWNHGKEPGEQDWSIGLWKDEANRAVQIKCEPGQEGVILKLRGKRQVEKTLDGRDNTQTFAWHRLGEPRPLGLDRTGDRELIARLRLQPGAT
ncbi:hypothetical protein [Methylobacterium radiodurans]|uniref:hypothetical protein n=1 Tax=Methylobacterium radiodurans TaxID=2202828 RepID=UPI00194FCC5E|nr:hypothetical protein [Methylobacterium radiodurans]